MEKKEHYKSPQRDVICPFNKTACGVECAIFDEGTEECSFLTLLNVLEEIKSKIGSVAVNLRTEDD